jgi:nucleotide-binding universal stress UspA family protein
MPLPLTLLGPEAAVYDATAQEGEMGHYKATLAAGVRKLAEGGLRAHGEVVTGDPVIEIARCAGRIDADLIVVGHKHLDGWAARWWKGSVSKALIEYAPCSVLVVITH